MQATPCASHMPLDVARLRLEGGTCLEAGQTLSREALPREEDVEEDKSPAHLRQAQQHAAAMQHWEEMATH